MTLPVLKDTTGTIKADHFLPCTVHNRKHVAVKIFQ